MTRAKKNLFVTVLAVMLVAVLTMTALVACGEETPETVKVTFKDGETVVASVDVAKGTTLELSKIPAAPVKDGYTFVGWYVGETKFDGTMTFDADTVFTAKYEANVTPAPETVSVTFKDGDADYKKVTVVKGEKIAEADLPTDPTKDGYTFVGWFNGETKFDGTMTFDADTVFTAKYEANVTPAPETVSVTFKDGDADYKKVTVVKGEKIAEADLPTDPTAALGYRFDGWFNGEAEFDEETAFSADATYTAKYTKVSYVVKFVNGEEETVKLIDIADNAKLTAETIPADPAKEGFVFMGWYSGMDKAATDVAVTADVTYKAVFSNEDSYTGYWINTTEGKESMIYFDKDNGKVTYTSQFTGKKTYEYKAKEGTIVYSTGTYTGKKTYTFTVIGEKLVVTLNAYDDVEENFVTTEIDVLERKAGTGLGGVYAKAQKSNVITVEDNGIISMLGSNGIPYGVVYTTVKDGVTVYHFDMRITPTGALKKLTAIVDENGNFIMSAEDEANASYEGIYAKDAEVTDFYYDGNYLVSIVKGEVTQYTYIVKDGGSYYATVTGTVALNNEITISYGDGLEAVYAITEMPTKDQEGNMSPASSERGTYTSADGSLYLDGFGKAVLTATADGEVVNSTYYINKVGIVILTDEYNNVFAMSIDVDARTCAVATSDGKSAEYKQSVSGSTSYTLTIDGFGGATVAVKYSWSTTPTLYYGTYAYAADGASVTLNITNYSTYNKTYSVEEDGNALVSADGNIVFLVPGFTAEDKSGQFVGYFVDDKGNAIEITSESSGMWIVFNGNNYQLGKNWNGTKLAFEAPDFDAAEGYTTWDRTYTVTMVDGKVVIAHDCIKSYDDTYEELETEAKSVTYTKTTKPFSFAESARGTWYLSDNTVVVISESTITVGGVEGTDYNKSESWGGYNYFFKINGTEYMIYEDSTTAGKWYYGLSSSYDAEELSATEHVTETLDGLEGTYVNGTNTITLDGKGNGVYNNGNEYTFTYSGTGSTKNVSNFADYDSGSNTITVTDTGLDVHFADSYGENVYDASFTKKAASGSAAIDEGMQGTFTGNNGYTTTFTLKVNADSIEYSEVDTSVSLNIKATITEYTIEDGGYTIAWTRNGVNYKFSSPMSGYFKLYVGDYDYTMTAGGSSEEPALTEIPEAFIGTWKGTDGEGEYKYVITATSIEFTYAGGNPSTYTMDSIEIAADGSKVTISGDSYFTVTSTGLNVKDVYSGGTYVDVDLTKEAEETLDAFAGTWTGKVGANTWNVVCDGKGNITINDTAYTYTAGSTSITANSSIITIKDGKMHVEYDDGEYQFSGDLVKA